VLRPAAAQQARHGRPTGRSAGSGAAGSMRTASARSTGGGLARSAGGASAAPARALGRRRHGSLHAVTRKLA